jgi:ribose/xylose/arabinose/galactoside ABC-type transport system permease subunit
MLQVSLIILTGAAATILLISGHFDLSIGSILAFAGVMHAFMSKYWFPTYLSLIIAICLGGLIGLLNGLMVSKLKITPIIATLGTMYAARGMAYIIARIDGGANITSGLPRNFQEFGRGMLGPIPFPVILMILVVIIFYFIQSKTNLGRYAFTIGANKNTSYLSGVKVDKWIILLYILTGLMAGLCGVILVSRLGSGVPRIGQGFEFDVIIAVVLGGTLITGGKGSVLGMVIGALIVGFVANGLNLLDVQSFYQTVIKGCILLGAILLERGLKKQLA